ncbi:MAG: GAF domain-containing protein [Lentisphaeria bacterium]|nr:GAF domain-containing protein [Lentisphaeria bacterium]
MLKIDQILLASGIKNPEEIKYAFQLLIQTGLQLLKADEGSLLIYRKAEKDLQFACTVGAKNPDSLIGKTIPIGKGITGMAAMTCEIQSASRANSNSFFDIADDGSPNSVIAAPMMIDDELIGVITAVSFDRQKSFNTGDCRNFSLLSQIGAIIISQQQQLANYASQQINSLTETDSIELRAADAAVKIIRKKPENAAKVLQMLSILGEL